MLTKIEKYLEKYAPIFISISMYYLIILLVWEIITKWVIITLR
jgi:hypothetical protein